MVDRENIKNSFLNIDEKNIPIIDVHTHAGFDHYGIIRKRYPTSQSVKDLVLKLEISNVDYAVTFPCPNSTYYFDLRSLPTKEHILEPLPVESFPYEFSNRQLFYEASLFGNNRIMPFAFIFPDFDVDKQIESLDEYAKKGLLFGLKHHTLVGAISAKRLINSPFMDLANKYSLPVIIHSGIDSNSRPEHVMDLAERYPDVNFCIAHAAEFEKSAYDRFAINKYTNVFFDCSPFISICKLSTIDMERGRAVNKISINFESPYDALIDLYKIIPNNLIWGTDEPWTTITDDVKGEILLKADYKDEANLLISLPKDIKEKISFTNTVNFLFK